MAKEMGCIACGHLISLEGFAPSRIEVKCKHCYTTNTLPKKQVLRKELIRYSGIRLNTIMEQDKLK